jgi:hypothetical protein
LSVDFEPKIGAIRKLLIALPFIDEDQPGGAPRIRSWRLRASAWLFAR